MKKRLAGRARRKTLGQREDRLRDRAQAARHKGDAKRAKRLMGRARALRSKRLEDRADAIDDQSPGAPAVNAIPSVARTLSARAPRPPQQPLAGFYSIARATSGRSVSVATLLSAMGLR